MNSRTPFFLFGIGWVLIVVAAAPLILAALNQPQLPLHPSVATYLAAGGGLGLILAAGWVWVAQRLS